ncbi:MAG TPA: hypothetical protein PKZ42_15845, partial [Syntrophales bacterium]|nr:hypothetical protein [Syntrophales bacterium]
FSPLSFHTLTLRSSHASQQSSKALDHPPILLMKNTSWNGGCPLKSPDALFQEVTAITLTSQNLRSGICMSLPAPVD